ncbi:ABC transporter ATP-binding protein [Thermus filiformis]|jgi:ABC-2 type transport system ATP-binding protein|uniref:ABC transporter ATP-binding protein n=1 Tax=Thermus filiformis TaxID=276 RepID=A0A0A2WR52_THEFI|nr:ABC transporter ATP-binding protein [Thermus filiformis]KGQ22631.1 ABC transporter ATP-binding protein [Thermus filiformis]
MGEEALSIQRLSKRYGRRPVLEGVSLSVRLGEVYALAGPNGSGKTTLIRLATGLAFPTQGEVFLLGEDVHKTPAARRHLGAVVEAPAAFYPHLTGRANLERHAYLLGLSRAEERIREVLARLRLLAVADQKVGGYSLGQRQRLGLAAALLSDPKVLVLDEPTSGLDPEGVELVHTLLAEASREGRAVLLSTHHLREVSAYAHRVGILGGGRLLEEVVLDGVRRYALEVSEPERARAFLLTQPGVLRASLMRGRILLEGDPEAALSALVREGFRVRAFYPHTFDLLDYYQEKVAHA